MELAKTRIMSYYIVLRKDSCQQGRMTVIPMIYFDADNIDPSNVTPMYKQVASIISEGIRKGELKAGEKLPSEFELMKDFKVSRVTIRGAVSELVADGLLARSQGKGTFVSPQKKLQSANDTTGLTDSCRQAGKVLKSQVLSVEYTYPTHADSEFLDVDESQQVIEIRRLRYIDGHPSILETLYFPRRYDFLTHENLDGSVFSILNAHGITIQNSKRTLEISNASPNEAGLLEIKRNSPLLLFKDYQSDGQGRPLFVCKQLYNTQNMIFYL